MGYSTISYAGVTINVKQVTPESIQAPWIQKIGRTLSITPVPTDTTAWRLSYVAELVGTSTDMDTDRASLQTAHDDKLQHALVDGLHNGNFVCIGLAWSDDANVAAGLTNMPFTITLLEKKFSGGF